MTSFGNVRKAILHPKKACEYVGRKLNEFFFWNSRYVAMREPKKKQAVPHDSDVHAAIRHEFEARRCTVRDLKIDVGDYQRYLDAAQYHHYPLYYCGGTARNFPEKSLEHYVAAKLLDLQPGDVFIDVANADAPTPDIYARLFRCTSYRQDLIFPQGVHGQIIGGDAGQMPVPAGFASKMALHCSFEHFEGDADTRFTKETSRVLRTGGRTCILPLYMNFEYAIQTDPAVLPRESIPFEDDAVLYCHKGYGERHGRFYDVAHFYNRIVSHLGDLHLTIYFVQNSDDVDSSCYLRFAAVFEKP